MDPYKVLGITPNSSIKDIKIAYEEKLKTYNEDDLDDNSFKELYTEKVNEANEAFRMINHNITLEEVRDLIEEDEFVKAEAKLNLISDFSSAEWNFLIGILLIKKGLIESGVNHVKEACKLNPYNSEYKDTLSELNKKVRSYKNNTSTNKKNNLNLCNNSSSNSNKGGLC
ncbi:MAG: J domain-containing protein [Clostridiales bacterium]|nr:J domain-containing protein [Clostridiales bacterium]